MPPIALPDALLDRLECAGSVVRTGAAVATRHARVDRGHGDRFGDAAIEDARDDVVGVQLLQSSVSRESATVD